MLEREKNKREQLLKNTISLAKQSAAFVTHCFLGYKKVTSGSDCKRIMSKEECEEAARQLELTDEEADEWTTPDWPPYCFFKNGKRLVFNNNVGSAAQCIHDAVCICKQ